LPLNLNAAL